MTDANEENLTEFIDFLSKPENLAASLFWKNDAATSDSTQQALRKTCQVLFQRVESLSKTYSKITEKTDQGESLTGLPELYTGSSDQGPVDGETLWGQVDLQNEALQSLLKKSIRNLDKATKTKGEEIRLLEDAGSDSDDEAMEEESEDNDADSAEGEDDDDDDQDSETKRIEARMERAMADMEDEDDSEDDDDELERSDRKQDKVATEEESVDDPAADELNDGFFDIQEMEEFADEEEEYLPDVAFGQPVPEKEETSDKRSFHQKQRDGEVDSGSDEDEEEEALFRAETTVRRKKYRQDDEIDALYSLYEEPKSDDEDEDDDDEDDDEDNDIINMTAADIFGKPKPKYFEKWNAKTHEKGKGKEKKDDDSWNDYDFDDDKEETTGWNDGEDADGFDENKNEESGSDEEDDERGDNGATKKSIGGTKKSLKKPEDTEAPAGGDPKADKLRRQVEELEKEMLAEKPWQMVGESTSTSRPVNSLLEMTPTFEAASKTAPMITVEHTADLEEIIKQRIISEDWDDVVPRELPDVGWHKKRGELPEVSQEKSKLGLGELYEREYLKKAVGYDVDAAEKESAEEQAKNEMKSLFANLCSKLDALSNYHFAPRPIADEAEVKAITTPAIAMEEVLPLHVSNSRATAPEEIYGAKRGREAVLQGESERDQQERKRLRGSKKATRRKVRKDKLADEKLISRLQPGMGLDNPYEKRKMREELSVARAHGKVTTGEEDTNTKYGASGTFFKRMQEEAEKTIRGGQDGDEKKEKRPKNKSSALKL